MISSIPKVIMLMIVSVFHLIIIVYFILKGSIVLHVDLNDPNINPDLNKTANNIKRRQTSIGANQDTQQQP